jgi:hypothetical protein
MATNEEQYIPRRKIKKSIYLELKKANEEYESILDIWGSSNGDDEKTRKIKARQLMQANPELSLYRSVLTTKPSEKEDEIAEGFRYWMMKENGTLPVKQKAETKNLLSIINPVVEDPEATTEKQSPADLSLTREIVIQSAVKDKPVGKKQKVTFGRKVAKFFGL